MKKLLVLCLTVLMAAVAFANVFADDDFVKSVEVRDNVHFIVDGKVVDSYEDTTNTNCNRKLVITPYVRRNTIESEYSKTELDIAYDELKKMKGLFEIQGMEKLAKSLGLSENQLVIRDVFDVTPYIRHDETAEDHDARTDDYEVYGLDFDCESLKNFVALIHYADPDAPNYVAPENETDQVWFVETGAKKINDTTLELTTKHLSPFAIVVKTGESEYVAPGTGVE